MSYLKENELEIRYFSDGKVDIDKGSEVPECIARLVSLPLLKNGYSKIDSESFTKSSSTQESSKIIKNSKFALVKSDEGATVTPIAQQGATNSLKIGATRSGKNIMSHHMPTSYQNWSADDHKDAANMHYEAANKTPHNNIKMHHMRQSQRHLNVANSMRVPPAEGPKFGSLPKPSVQTPYVQIPGKGRGEPKGF